MFGSVGKRITDKLKKLLTAQEDDFIIPDDPVARQTEWTPINTGSSSNFCTARLRMVSASCCEFRSTIAYRLFMLLFALIGGGILLFCGKFLWEKDWGLHLVIMAGVGALFLGIAIYLFRRSRRIPVFDKAEGAFYLAGGRDGYRREPERMPEYTRLKNVYALMLLKRRVEDSDGGSYSCYELDLVRSDGSRCFLIQHGGRAQIHEDTRKLADFLDGIPVWERDCSRLKDEKTKHIFQRLSRKKQ